MNMNEQTIDERCAYEADVAQDHCIQMIGDQQRCGHISGLDVAIVLACADRIIALRTQQAQVCTCNSNPLKSAFCAAHGSLYWSDFLTGAEFVQAQGGVL